MHSLNLKLFIEIRSVNQSVTNFVNIKPLVGGLLALPANIRQRKKCLPGKNTLAYLAHS